MTASTPPVINFGWPAPDFRLTDTRGKVWTRATLRGPKGLLIMFIANHCPYVLAVIDKLAKQGREVYDLGFGVAAICSNDSRRLSPGRLCPDGRVPPPAPPAVPLSARPRPERRPRLRRRLHPGLLRIQRRA